MEWQSVDVSVIVKDVTKGPTSAGHEEKSLLRGATVRVIQCQSGQAATSACPASMTALLLSGSERLWMVKFKCSEKFLKNSESVCIKLGQ